MNDTDNPSGSAPRGDSDAKGARNSAPIVRGRRLVLVVIAIALAGALIDAANRLYSAYSERVQFEQMLGPELAGTMPTYNWGSMLIKALPLVMMAVVAYLLYKGNIWGKIGVATYFVYGVVTEGLGLLTFLGFASRAMSQLTLGVVFLALVGVLGVALPAVGLAILVLSQSVKAFLESQREASLSAHDGA